MATSGTVSQTVFNTNKLIDHAFRRCKIAPQQITPEYQQTAQDLLFLLLSTLASKGIALWCIQKEILPLYENVQTVPCPVGTVDVLNANLRTIERLSGTPDASEGAAENAFDGDLTTDCTQTIADGWISLELDSAASAPIFGIYPASSGEWSIAIQASNDGTTWTDLYVNTALDVVTAEWFWVDIEGVLDFTFYRLKANDGTILDVGEFVIANLPNEIPVAKINRDDYANLPNKFFQGRPVQFWYDKQRSPPLMQLWPAPQEQYAFAQIILYVQRYVQDVGSLTQEVEVPQRWYLAVVLMLAKQLAMEIPEVKPGVFQEIAPEALMEERKAWDSETDSSPSFILPNISPYTR
jgi:hypothetical protein